MYKRRQNGRIILSLLAGVLTLATLGTGVFAAPALPRATAYFSSVLCAPDAALAATRQVLDAAMAAQASPTDATSQPPAASSALPPETPAASAPQSAPPAAASAPPAEQEPVPEGMAAILSTQYKQGSGPGYVASGAGTVRNCTSLPDSEVAAEMMQPLPFSIQPGSPEPQVLIMHTHATETYEAEDKGWTDPAFAARSTDTSVNMVAVGAEIAAQLNAAGIVTLHDATLHDYPSYNGSYGKSNATVRRYLEQYPSIKVVLDVHRDAIQQQDGTRIKPVAQINGRTAAQVMIICGADVDGNLPNCKQNLRFASRWQDKMESLFPGLTRPVLFDYRYYNQDLTTGSLLIEMGGHANTLAEALYAGQLVGQSLAALFTGN